MKRYFEFRIKSAAGGRNYIMLLPEDKIEKIETQEGSEAVYCVVNGEEIDGDYEKIISILGDVTKCY